MNKRKLWASALSLSLLTPALAACSFTGDAKQETPQTLRIATTTGWFDEEYFRREYTELFELEYKNIEVEIVQLGENYRYSRGPREEEEDPMVKLKEAMQGPNPPDVVLFSYDQMPELVNENLLSPLESMIKENKFNTEDIVPAVLDGIKQVGNGQIYALSPTFYSSALVYNKAMFDEAGVGYPTDGMSWNDLFDLAKRVSKDDGSQYGFNFYSYGGSDLFSTVQNYANVLRLRTFDKEGEKMTVDSDSWEEVWKTVIQLGKDKVIPFMDPNNPEDFSRFNNDNPFGYNDFLSGRLAMTIISLYEIKELINANKEADNIEGYTPIQWDIVSVPTAPDGSSYNFGFSDLMAINAKAPNPKAAWKYIEFMNGEDWAKLKSRSSNNLISNKKYTKRSDGEEYNVEAFYNVKPAPPETMEDYQIYRKLPNIYDVVWLGQKYFNEAMEGKTGIRDALKAWQEEGDALLLQMKENPDTSSFNRGGSDVIAVPAG